MKKATCLFLCLAIILGIFSACKSNGKPDEKEETTIEITTQIVKEPEIKHEVRIGYFENRSLNPYQTDSNVNRNLLSLVYDSLFVIDDDFTALPQLADTFTNEGNKLTVKLCDDLYFSDGSPISPADVVYSFNLAKSDVFYKERLKNFNNAVQGEESVIFTLRRSNIFAESCLVFPIIKHGTGNDKYPIGSGRYFFKKADGVLYLKENEASTHGEELTTKRIRLVPISAEESELYQLQSGDLTCFYDDLSDSSFTKINANMVRVPLNNLVYLAFNSNSKALSDLKVREAIEMCVDKRSVADSAYDGFCRVANGVFNPDWAENPSESNSKSVYNTIQAGETLEKANYVYAYKNNKYRSKNFEFLKLRFVVNKENKARVEASETITKAMRSAGIDVSLSKLSFEDYKKAIESGAFDLYLGEVRLSPDMDLSVFFAPGGEVSYGMDKSSTVAGAYFDFLSGTVDFLTFNQVFNYEKPFIPICYRDGVACFSRELLYEGSINQYDLFKNVYSWEISP